MRNQELARTVDEKALRDDFDHLQKQISKWSDDYPLDTLGKEEVTGIHYVEEGECDYKVTTSASSTV